MSLLPNLDTRLILGPTTSFANEATVESNEPRVNGTGSVTVAGAVGAGDILTIAFTSGLFSNGSYSVASAAAVAGDTDAIMAEKLANAINSDSTLRNLGVYATAAGAVVTINWPGPLGSMVTFNVTTGGAETFTKAQISGGSGPIQAFEDTRVIAGNQTLLLRKDRYYSFDSIALAALVAGGITSIR